jgi:hypothetical protein
VILEGATTDEEGNPAAPQNPRILLKPPSGAETPLAVEFDPDNEGRWFHELYLTGPAGKYFYRLLQTGDAEELFFVVVPSAFTTPLPP